jgi:hypothetical protein
MSMRGTCKTEIDNEDDLTSAIDAIYGKNTAEKTENGITVKIAGVYGRPVYQKQEDGRYTLVYDSMDRYRLKELLPQKKEGKPVHRLMQEYSRIKVGKALKTIRGARVVSEETDSEVHRIRIKIPGE